MTWFFKTGVFCATIVLLGISMEILGYTQLMCKEACQDEPDNILCTRWMSTADGSEYAPGKPMKAEYQWMRNECEKKCFMYGDYNTTVDMEYCTRAGQNYTTYRCSEEEGYPDDYEQCLRNASMH